MTVRSTSTLPDIILNRMGLYEGDLCHYFRVAEAAPNRANGYHGLRHPYHVLFLCHLAALYYQDKLTPREIRNLLIAALFHDYGHLGGKAKSDRENIERAVVGLRKHCLDIDRPYLSDIEDIMWATEYPHKDADKEPLVNQIIQDTDLCQAFDTAWYTITIHGLGGELGLTPLQMLERQPAFIRSIVFKTAWAEQQFPLAMREAKIAEAQDFIACYERA
jgi:hypothetical protein